MKDERVQLTLPKRFRSVLDKLSTPLEMTHTEFVKWLIDSYNARDLAFIPTVTAQSLIPVQPPSSVQPHAQSLVTNGALTADIQVDESEFDDDF
ncbi:hypothetical protein U2F10_36075 [Leptothoe sp. EHU-05/26/07-4]